MRKKYLLFALALGFLTACDPCKEDGNFDITNISSEQLLAGATFEQYAAVKNEDGSFSYTPADNGNYIKYDIPSVSSVQIYYLKSDGSEFVLSSGSSGGMFSFIPSRGSDPNQAVYFRFVNQEGEEVVASKEFTLAVAADLTTEVKLLASNDGKKTWKWNTAAPDGQVWGNMGSNGSHDGESFALTGNGKWWGVTNDEEFLGQLNHTDDGQAHGDESMDATMVFTEDGMIYCYDKDGNKIREGKYEVQNYDPAYSTTSAYCGILHTDAGSILFPYEINSGGRKPTDFQIAYLSTSRLVLVYPDNGAWGDWSEGTFWQFCSISDIVGCLTDNSEATWEWDTTGLCWGNGQYAGNDGADFADNRSNQWWGVDTPEGLLDQLNHSDTGVATGEESSSAYMVFTNEGVIKSYNGAGEEIRSGSYSVSTNNGKRVVNADSNCPWQLGTLTTSAGAILFPFKINGNGEKPTDFDILKITDDQLVLVYGGNGTWGECTFWRFQKKR